MAMQQVSDDSEVKATRIFNCLAELDEGLWQDFMSESEVFPYVFKKDNISANQERLNPKTGEVTKVM